MAVKDSKYFQFLEELNQRHECNNESWTVLAEDFSKRYKERVSRSGIRHRVQNYINSKQKNANLLSKCSKTMSTTFGPNTFVQYNSDGTVEESKVISCKEEVTRDPKQLLEYLGYDSTKWELVTYRVSKWESAGDETKELHSVQYKVKPRLELSVNDITDAVRDAFKDTIKPIKFEHRERVRGLNNNMLMEIPPVELHLGKLSNEIETGENYDIKIAQRRFFDIFEEIYQKQEIERCGSCLLVIGSDFFNSESDNCTSKDKIPQQNDTRYIKLFTEGIRMYTQVILSLREMFNTVNVMLCAGNHARAMETFLYMALEQRFVGDTIVNFNNSYRLTQAYVFGNCAIFYNHGDANLKQTIKSIPAEFAKIWGQCQYRELHLGHLHKEVTVDDEGGMITRRVGSPCSTDAWHYSNRYVGAVKKHQIFVWNSEYGLKDLYYIPVVE